MINYRITPVMMNDQSCDGVWTDGNLAWIGKVESYRLLNGDQRVVVLPLTDEAGQYVAPPADWHALIVEQLSAQG